MEIKVFIENLEIGEAAFHANMTMFPLLTSTDREPGYIGLGPALANGLVRISEISRGGSVPTLRFVNQAELPVLIVDGEELVGAKQNRVANLTILAPARTTITIPVSCVEAGRWRYDRNDFMASERAQFARGRASKVASVSHSMAMFAGPHSDQGRVWADISAKAARMRVDAPTRAMSDIFEHHRGGVEEYVKGLSAVEEQSGAIFAIGARIIGMDLFDQPSTLREMLPKLVRSYAIDAIETAGRDNGRPGADAARSFLDRVAEAEVETYPAVGLGTDIRLNAGSLVGAGLVLDDTLVHLAAFARESSNGNGRAPDVGMAGIDHRRRSFFRRR
jgi:hypothetical protein